MTFKRAVKNLEKELDKITIRDLVKNNGMAIPLIKLKKMIEEYLSMINMKKIPIIINVEKKRQ